MVPNLKDGEVLILNKINYKFSKIKRFDIVVLDETNLVPVGDEKLIIKRIIGLPGEYLEYKNNSLFVNGEEVIDNFSDDVTTDFTLQEICNCSKIPADKYLVLGDNRDISKDSRMIGLIDKNDIKGKTNFRIFPFNKIGKID